MRIALLFGAVLLSSTVLAQPKIALKQDDQLISLQPGDTAIRLHARTFEVQIEIKPYTDKDRNVVSLAATLNPKDSIYFQENSNSDDNPYFSPGSGFPGPYDCLLLVGYGQHYLHYDPSDEVPRLTLLRKNDDGTVLTKWVIEHYWTGRKNIKLSKLTGKTVYLMFWSDLNRNEQIDKGEYSRVRLTLTK